MLTRTKISTVLAAGIAAAGLLTGTGGTATADVRPASAAVDCTPPYHENNSTGWGKLKGTYNLKKAPYASCGNVTSLGSGTKLYFHCYVINSYGNVWVYVRKAGTETHGWMSYANFGEISEDAGFLPCSV
ncbi:hypothetical protein ABZ016_24550 [Streptomyces sp. NPDC006372]|uniref:hypothetical protein n=1 Tax=Streptomyces sp. NPDC006372 TaxID=3155599 RepID=UPI0033B827A9